MDGASYGYDSASSSLQVRGFTLSYAGKMEPMVVTIPRLQFYENCALL